MTALSHYDAQLKIRSVVPDFDAYIDRYRALSAEARSLLPNHLDVPYGPSMLERLDVFMPSYTEADRSVHIFFHGGYWRAFDKDDYSYVARPIVEAGAVAIIANYGLMPAISMAELLSQCRVVIRWVFANAAQFGGSSQRISISGHSAGGHIATLLHLTSWTEYSLPGNVIKSTVAVSGIYDLAPVLKSFLQAETGLTDEDVAQFSPIACTNRGGPATRPLFICFGAHETDEFRRQSEDFAAALSARGAPVEVRALADRHHMDIVLDLGDARSELGQLLITQIMATD